MTACVCVCVCVCILSQLLSTCIYTHTVVRGINFYEGSQHLVSKIAERGEGRETEKFQAGLNDLYTNDLPCDLRYISRCTIAQGMVPPSFSITM